MSDRPLYSICHTTARPTRWRASYDAWLERAAYPDDVEYVLCVDDRWGSHPADEPLIRFSTKANVVWNTGPKSCVSGWNTAAAASTGGIIILNADDMRPPKEWDKQIRNVLEARGKDPWKDEFVLHVSVGGSADKRNLIILQILSRARYERLGYALYPGYESMFSDDEFTASAKLDGCYIDARDELQWLHHHPYNGIGKIDEVYEHQNRPQAYEQGKALFERRRKEGFPALEKEKA